MSTEILFQPVQVGELTAPNRIVLAPLTRSRATDEGVPTALMATYYGQRAGAGLIVSEGTVVSPQGASYARVPGLYTPEQVAGWRPVVAGAKRLGAVMFAQLWHVGRQAHSSLQPDGLPGWAPSAVPITGYQYRSPNGRIPFETPRELSVAGISEIIAQFTTAAMNAREAGFDGVELHGANGYLIDQFLAASANHRTDKYGGSVTNRLRFLTELLDALSAVIPLSRVGLRLSPSSSWMDISDPDRPGLYGAVARLAGERGVAYLHLVEPGIAGSVDTDDEDDAVSTTTLARLFGGTVIVTGGHTAASAVASIASGEADLVGFGRSFIANPDLPYRMKAGAPLEPLRSEGLYGGGPVGYTDYPCHPDNPLPASETEDEPTCIS